MIRDSGARFTKYLTIYLPLTVSCFSKIQIGFTFLVLAHLGSPRKRAVKRGVVVVVYRKILSLQCFDAVGWAAGRASGL